MPLKGSNQNWNLHIFEPEERDLYVCTYMYFVVQFYSSIVFRSLDLTIYENGVETNQNKILPRTKEWH